MSGKQSNPRDPVPCKFCGADIVWAYNERTGKPMPFGFAQDPTLRSGWFLAYRQRENRLVCRYIREREKTKDQLLREPHFAICSNYNPETKGAADRTKAALGPVHDAVYGR